MTTGLAVALTTDREHYLPGGTIVAELRVVNRADREVVLRFTSGQRYDFIVEYENGGHAWRWAADRVFTQVLGEETLGPGRGELVYRERLPAPTQPGRYRITGMLTGANRRLSATVSVEVRTEAP